ncbi:hypothetical protein QMK19_04155 [Streptomyces sp. H10-C2]|uniref:hypothetical protein n=1 Tax=unclassified Streptomyces TaxID=2593676 RepID=UPI0024BAFE98|nr:MULTISPECIES: hypothetical protein [unclassified Streptomyces]MDJ0343528.1 hypothetical protein [Streptomyces sp. PH10-H1]MDJ0368896.1 hypothetical protein [Streptomyces sp. H10-C2]
MSDVMSKSQSLQGEYEARVAADLRQNEGDRDRVIAQIAALQEELEILVQDREMLLSMQDAVSSKKQQSASEQGEAHTAASSEPEAHVVSHAKTPKVPGARRRAARKAVPSQGRTVGRGRKNDNKSSAADAGHAVKTATAKTATAKSTTAKTATKPAKATTEKAATAKPADGKAAAPKADKLVKVVEDFLVKQGAPASAAEVTTAISTPERAVTVMSVRTALEGLVRKSAALRSKQARSVYYESVTAGAANAVATAAPQGEPAAQ